MVVNYDIMDPKRYCLVGIRTKKIKINRQNCQSSFYCQKIINENSYKLNYDVQRLRYHSCIPILSVPQTHYVDGKNYKLCFFSKDSSKIIYLFWKWRQTYHKKFQNKEITW